MTRGARPPARKHQSGQVHWLQAQIAGLSSQAGGIAALPRGRVATRTVNSVSFTTSGLIGTATGLLVAGRRYRAVLSVGQVGASQTGLLFQVSFGVPSGCQIVGTGAVAYVNPVGAGYTSVREFTCTAASSVGVTFSGLQFTGSGQTITFVDAVITVDDIGT